MKRKKLRVMLDYIFIYIGTLIAAMGINLFLVPAKLAPGGVTGISIIVNSFTGISLGNLMFIINIPIFLVGLKVFGKAYGLKTLLGITFLSFNIDIIKYIIPNYQSLVDFTKGGNLFLAPIYGGLFMGIGLGTVMKSGGTTGGSDIVAGILNKYFRIPMGQAFIMIDFCVISTAAYIFGIEKALYALINLYTTGVVINKVIEGKGGAKMAYIVTSKYEEVKDIIIRDLNKTGNLFRAEALYTGNERKIIMTVLRNREVFLLKELISGVDKEAFVIISDAHEVMGRGYTFEVEAGGKKKMDKILLKGMKFYGYHGVLPAENQLGQNFYIDLEMAVDFREAAKTDNIEKSVSYAEVYEIVKEIVETKIFKLIEALGEEIAKELLTKTSIKKIKVRVRKPEAPIPGNFEYAGIEIERVKEEYVK